ncbi:hypothetical protein LF599_14290 [Pseudodesulfovibrio thermohalotolerans]|uniref:hypothetical protein n=1 Tax=Pseudodesulfovibrio thermohalotolerans TaxID=2880651 RepID=UPI0022B9EAA1|nr:hypothetical protein [Pseudodesulfovibrio thermohalotolerans]WFS61830.1 hypothetical protein LF599_14290 [Pseudodesulfovibrio thermohalotolerans]
MMGAIWIILPAGYILGMIALAVFFGGGDGNRTIANGRRDDDDVVGIFDDIMDPAKLCLIGNIHHDDSIGDDSSFDWNDSSLGDDMSSSMWDD